MIAIGVSGVVISIAAVIVGEHVIGQIETSVDDSLELTNDALTAVSDSITVIDSLVTTTRSGMASVRRTIGTIESSLGDATTALADSGEFLGGSLPESLDAVQTVLHTIESVAGSVDRALRVLERVPFGPSYNPEQPFDQAITNLSQAIEPLPGELRALGGDLQRVGSSADTVTGQMAELTTDIDTLDVQLGKVAGLLDRYSVTVARAEHLASSSRDHLAERARWAQLLLVLFGVVFALGQIVPLWLGSELISTPKASPSQPSAAP